MAQKHSISVTIIFVLVLLVMISLGGCTKEIPLSKTIKKNGKLFIIGQKKPFSGWVTGKERSDYRTEKMAFKKSYKKGLLHGKTIYWYDNGNIESIEMYKKGKLNGITKQYYKSGKKKAFIHFDDGERGGKELFWDEEGKTLR